MLHTIYNDNLLVYLWMATKYVFVSVSHFNGSKNHQVVTIRIETVFFLFHLHAAI